MSNYDVQFNLDDANHCWSKAFRLIEDNSTVLDVGCSKGAFGEAVKSRKKCTIHGVEPDEEDAKLAEDKLDKVINSTIEEAYEDLEGVQYDHIVFLDVIEHIVDPVTTLKNMKKYLKENGTVVFSIPNMAHLSVRLMLMRGEFEYGKTGLLDNTHLHFYTKKEIHRIFNEAGYSIDVMDYTEATYPPKLIRSELKKIGITLSPKLQNILEKEDSKIFQYVGSAKVSRHVVGVERLAYSPDPQGSISTLYEAELNKLKQELAAMKSEIAEIGDTNEKLSEKLAEIQQSRTYKVAQNLSRFYNLFK